ncbi:hypothetical protein LPJ55_004783 [Coemansia sp. RSA 990]|nr:hypothetical protein LPJ55_004783 [Coemansia sp. RSA 990]
MDPKYDAEESNIVFIGNVGYATTEEQLRKMLELAGPVVDIQLVFDPITNRAKGFGFCQFADKNIAASAIKNLNDTLVDGRNIKIGYADRGRVRRYLGTDGTMLSGGNGGTLSTRSAIIENNAQPTPQPRSTSPSQVLAVMDMLDEQQKHDFLAQFNAFAGFNPTKAREELIKNPALAFALANALESFGAVDPGVLGNPYGGSRAPSRRSSFQSTGGSRPYQSPYMPTQQSPPYQQSPSHYSSRQQSMQSNPEETDNAQVLQQLLSLTDDQLSQLPEEQRNQIISLRQQISR